MVEMATCGLCTSLLRNFVSLCGPRASARYIFSYPVLQAKDLQPVARFLKEHKADQRPIQLAEIPGLEDCSPFCSGKPA